jgi:hypothetical protein
MLPACIESVQMPGAIKQVCCGRFRLTSRFEEVLTVKLEVADSGFFEISPIYDLPAMNSKSKRTIFRNN